MSFDIQINTT